MTILRPDGTIDLLGTFPVVELRRYLIKPGRREEFATYFDAYFPDAFQHAGSIIAASLLERDQPDVFTWLRGFHSYADRATVNSAFYSGPLWAEHGATMNARLLDHENTLLLQRVEAGDEVSVLRTVDAVEEPEGARGLVLALVSRVADEDAADAVIGRIHDVIATADVDSASLRSAGVLRTLDADNNFPGLPFRTDGPYVVWLAVAADRQGAAVWSALAEAVASGTEAELIVGAPSARSRLRWRADDA